jgi:hypothetical protein
VALVRTDVSEERIAFIIRVTRIGELGNTLTVINNRRTPVTRMLEAIRSSEMSVLTRATLHNIPEGGIHINQPYY